MSIRVRLTLVLLLVAAMSVLLAGTVYGSPLQAPGWHDALAMTGAIVVAAGAAFLMGKAFHAELHRERQKAREMAASAETSSRLYREAVAANLSKDEYLANVSHELRTPLNAILGWTQILLEGDLPPPSVKRALETIERNARMQARLVEDILEISRIVAGKLTIDREPLELRTPVEAALSGLGPAGVTKGVEIRAILDRDVGLVDGDAARLQQVVWNLLSNALKFTPKGGRIDVCLERAGSDARIVVRDTGRGIALEFLPYVFDRFRQQEAQSSRSQGGLGLGLSIVRQLVELHGGTVAVQSEGEGKGSTFTVTLPLLSPAESVRRG